MSAGLMARVWAIPDEELKETRLLTLLSLAYLANDKEQCWLSIPQLAKRVRVSDRQTQRAIQWLIEKDYVKIIEKGNGRGRVTLYLVWLKGDIGDIKDDKMSPFGEEKGDIGNTKHDKMSPFNDEKGDISAVKGDTHVTLYSHARSGRLGRSLSSTEKRKKPTYLPTSQTDLPPLDGAQQLAFELLADGEIGIIHSVATELARKLPAQDIYRAVDKWLPDAQAGKVTAGALKHRLEKLKPSNAPVVTLSAGFLVSDLFQRHRLPEELVSDGRKKYSQAPAQEPRKKYSP